MKRPHAMSVRRLAIMAWFRNFNQCHRCDEQREDEWSRMVDGECLHCRAAEITRGDAQDLTWSISRHAKRYAVLRSPDAAEHNPGYEEIARFPTLDLSATYIDEAEE